MATVIDYHSEVLQDSFKSVGGGVTNQGIGESFTVAGLGCILNSAKFNLNNAGTSPTGNAVAKIYTHSGVYGTSSVPTGTALATSDNLDTATLTSSFALYTLNFSGVNKIKLTGGNTYYVVTLEYSGGDASNFIRCGNDSNSYVGYGNQSVLASSVWSATGLITTFYVYSDTPMSSHYYIKQGFQ